jgi:hypothetical protein
LDWVGAVAVLDVDLARARSQQPRNSGGNIGEILDQKLAKYLSDAAVGRFHGWQLARRHFGRKEPQ